MMKEWIRTFQVNAYPKKLLSERKLLTTLYASVSLNGQVLIPSQQSAHSPVEVSADFMKHVKEAGNMIMGRTTAQSLLRNPEVMKAFASIHLVILSDLLEEGDNYVVARSPEDALTHLASMGYNTAFIAGGAKVYQAFLSKNLVDNLIVNISPEVSTNGLELISQTNFIANYGLVAITELTRDITQLKLSSNKIAIL